jgi:hypothetical protein
VDAFLPRRWPDPAKLAGSGQKVQQEGSAEGEFGPNDKTWRLRRGS